MNESLDSMCSAYEQRLRGLNAVQIKAHPAGDSEEWNVLQLVEHLVLTYRSTSRALEVRLQKGRPTKSEATPEQLARRKELFERNFPERTKAPEIVRPGQIDFSTALSGVELAEFLRKEVESMDGLIDQCDEAFGHGPMASHFAYGPLSAEEWRRFHVIHGRHHLQQLEKILRG